MLRRIALVPLLISILLAGCLSRQEDLKRNATGDAVLENYLTREAAHLVKYQISGSFTNQQAHITYENQTGGTEQRDIRLPWSVEYKMATGQFAYISVQNTKNRGVVKCAILDNGTVWKEAESRGAYVIASCSGSVGRD